MDSIILGAIIAGAVIGAIPAILGAVKGKIGLGLGGFASCLIGSIILGMILSIPLCAIFVYLILKKDPDNTSLESKVVKPAANDETQNDILAQIQKLSELKESGVLSEAEFQEKKEQLLKKI